MTLGDAITTIKSQSGSKKSLMSLRSSLKSLLLPSQVVRIITVYITLSIIIFIVEYSREYKL